MCFHEKEAVRALVTSLKNENFDIHLLCDTKWYEILQLKPTKSLANTCNKAAISDNQKKKH